MSEQASKLFGSVTTKDVSKAIEEQFDISIDRRKMTMDDIKSFGTFLNVILSFIIKFPVKYLL